MGLFRRSKKKRSRRTAPPAQSAPPDDRAEANDSGSAAEDVAPRVGVVSEVLSPSKGADHMTPFGDVVERRFGPEASREAGSGGAQKAAVEIVISDKLPPRHKPRRKVDSLLDEQVDDSDSLNLEIDAVALIGNATTITGNIVSEEDLEIQGRVEGSIHLENHRVTVGTDGIVKATVAAKSVEVLGKITGNVIATELVEIKSGGVITGDVKAPRVIMNDGGVVVGGLDMSAALTGNAAALAGNTSGDRAKPPVVEPDRPKLIKVEPDALAEAEEGGA